MSDGGERLPSGVVTFLLTDVERSTRMWEEHPAEMDVALRRHDQLMHDAVTAAGGTLLKSRGEGDSTFSVFARASDAATAALAAQEALAVERWPGGAQLRVRMAIHTGEAVERSEDYYGPAVNRAARLRAIASGAEVLVTQPVASVLLDAVGATWAVEDLGERTLKDLGRSERVWRLQASADTLVDRDRTIRNWRKSRSSFVGREEEIAELVACLESGQPVTIVGPGGCGKTRLADEVGRRVFRRYPDGVWAIALSSVDDSRAVPETACRALGVDLGNQEPLVALARHVAGRRMLVIVDNCEQVNDGAAKTVEVLAHHVAVLSTSRNKLDVRREIVARLTPLPVPTTTRRLTGDAARLFLDRARAVDPNFALADDTVADLAGICREVEGLPLALELAAARLRAFSPAQLLERLSAALNAARSADPNREERHQTIDATIDWSVSLLDTPTRALFRRLAVFRSGWTLGAAESVCAGDDLDPDLVLSALSELVEQSLVSRDADSRYRMLIPLREFGWKRLNDAGEVGLVSRAHFAFFRDLVVSSPASREGAQGSEGFDQLDADALNITAALSHGFTSSDTAEQAVELVTRLAHWWERRGATVEARRFLDMAFASAASLPEPVQLRLHSSVVRTAYLQGHFATVLAHIEAATELCRRLGDARALIPQLLMHALAGSICGGADVAAVCHEALELARSLGDEELIARAEIVAGRVAMYAGDIHAAVDRLERGLAAASGEHVGVALTWLIPAHALAGDPDAARRCVAKLAAILERSDDDLELIDAWFAELAAAATLLDPSVLGDPRFAKEAEPWRAMASSAVQEFVRFDRRTDAIALVLFAMVLEAEFGTPEVVAVLDGVFSDRDGPLEVAPQHREQRRRAVEVCRAAVDPAEWERLWNVGVRATLEDVVDLIAADARRS